MKAAGRRIVTKRLPIGWLALSAAAGWAGASGVQAAMPDMTMAAAVKVPAAEQAYAPGASPPLRNPDDYAEGFGFGALPRPRFADERAFGSLLVDRLEWMHGSADDAAYDVQAWYGLDYNRAVLKAEGDVGRGRVQEGRAELLWDRAVFPFWDAQFGVRYDHGAEAGRGWLALGVQGLAPYWFGIDVTAYLREAGRTALRIAADYELLFTQRLVLQPRLEMNFYGQTEPGRAEGTGLAETRSGLRLRYEIRREVSPYVGIEWVAKHGGTAASTRAAGEADHETRWVAGVRLWL